MCLATQLCPTLCDPMDCSPPGSSVHRDSPGKNTGAGCHTLLQEIFPPQGSNPGLPQRRWILYSLSHQARPGTLERVAFPFSKGNFPTHKLNRGLLHCSGVFISRAAWAALLFCKNKTIKGEGRVFPEQGNPVHFSFSEKQATSDPA